MNRLSQGMLICLAVSLIGLAGCGGGGENDFRNLDQPAPPPPAASTKLSGTYTNALTAADLDEYVTMTLTPFGGGAPIAVDVENDGTYEVKLAAGTYTLSASRPGYEDEVIGSVIVTANQTTVRNVPMDPQAANTYITSAQCGVCHEQKFETFRRTGHPFKINKVTGGQTPTYPFSDITGALAMVTDEDGVTDNTLGTPASYFDISYVIGGFGWKVRWMDANGFIVTGSEVQYNLATMGMAAYHDNETDKPFNCGNCHTTGWKHWDAVLNDNRQDNLPGIDGTFAEPGIQCESCHGAGATHAQTMNRADITEVATPRTTADFLASDMAFGKAVACGECHTRDGEKDHPTFVSAYTTAGGPEAIGGRIAASGGFVRHHEQYDELLGVDPDDVPSGSTRSGGFKANHLDCLTCHSSHTTTRYQDDPSNPDSDGVKKTNADCMVCHADKDPNDAKTGSMKGLNCTDCHMPKMSKSAVATAAVGTGPETGDVTSHIFSIDMTKADQFTASGSFAYPYITKTWACLTCHNGVTAHDRSTTDDTGYDFHN